MIARLSGSYAGRSGEAVVVDVGGVGFGVHVPQGFFQQQREVGDPVELHIHTHVRESEISLYGFDEPEERELFELLLTVSGIGPRTALACLSTLSPEVMREAIAAGEAGVFTRIPGIGAKTAQRMLLDLKDRVGHLVVGSGAVAGGGPDREVIEALMALGYTVSEAQSAVRAVPKDITEVDQRIVAALRQMAS
ncbi:MAG: Holliday junction branch migration protein RuvA [Anaerolineae bacterium]|jgi:Holliday junction DNA helicase RuvA